MSEDILLEKIKYLTTMPHSVLVEHCIYLEQENDNYRSQKYITDFITENGIICEKNKEIERLNNIINELEKTLKDDTIDVYCCTRSSQKTMKSALIACKMILLDKLQELKESK